MTTDTDKPQPTSARKALIDALKRQNPHETDEVIKLMNAAASALTSSLPQGEAGVGENWRDIGEDACSRYVDWYAHGKSDHAGGMAYDLVSAIRAMLAASPAAKGEDDEAAAERRREECIGRNLPAGWKP